jgi:predicted small secreted protein
VIFYIHADWHHFEETIMKLTITLLSLLLTTAALLAGCQNTVSGLGQDMQNTGKAIEKSVNSK